MLNTKTGFQAQVPWEGLFKKLNIKGASPDVQIGGGVSMTADIEHLGIVPKNYGFLNHSQALVAGTNYIRFGFLNPPYAWSIYGAYYTNSGTTLTRTAWLADNSGTLILGEIVAPSTSASILRPGSPGILIPPLFQFVTEFRSAIGTETATIRAYFRYDEQNINLKAS